YFTYYYPTTQQTPSSLPFPVLVNPHNSIKPPPPFIIQLIPPPTHQTLTKLQQAITQIQPLSKLIHQPLTPQPILNQIFPQPNLQILNSTSPQFQSNSTHHKFLN
ncbi:Hsp33 family molecular chaperone HslO, partial [Staphylococcus epidermidis]|uniref:Hsp33 family molecular chaperone HslO n=1 Tax=Staphylococcus epidermidis TaxID=1282 RepID=UPI0016424566